MSNINSKEYLKKYITRAIQGKLEASEIQTLKASLMNYSQAEWKQLIATGKELAAEAIEQEMAKKQEIPEDWKVPLKDLFTSLINFYLTILNEEVLHQAMAIERNGGGLSEQEKIIKILPLISRQMDKISGQSNLTVSNPYKVEKSLVNQKLKPLISEIKAAYFMNSSGRKISESQALAKLDKMANVLKSLSSEEIKVLKWKLKNLVLKLIHNYAPTQITNSPEVMGLIKSSLNLMDAVGEENLMRDWFNLIGKAWVGFRNSGGSPEEMNKGPIAFFKYNPGLETELKNFVIRYTQHINQLAQRGGTDTPSLPTNQKEILYQKLAGDLATSNPNPESSGGELSWTNNLLAQSFNNTKGSLGSGTGNKEFNMSNLLRDLEDLTTVQNKPKWYQNPWVIVLSLIGAVVLGGLTVWLFMRKKEPKKEWRE